MVLLSFINTSIFLFLLVCMGILYRCAGQELVGWRLPRVTKYMYKSHRGRQMSSSTALHLIPYDMLFHRT